MTNTIHIGIPEADDELVVLCANLTDPLVFPDNIVGVCKQCGAGVQYRPHGPAGPTVTRLCYSCAAPGIIEAKDADDLHVHVSKETVEEVRDYLKKKMN